MQKLFNILNFLPVIGHIPELPEVFGRKFGKSWGKANKKRLFLPYPFKNNHDFKRFLRPKY